MPCEIITIQPGNAGPERTLEVRTEAPGAAARQLIIKLANAGMLTEQEETALRRGILFGDEDGEFWTAACTTLLRLQPRLRLTFEEWQLLDNALWG